MYRRILVPLDLSDRNEAALATAGRIAREQEASITLLHVVETLDAALEDDLEGFYAELTEKAESRLAGWAQSLSETGARVEIGVLRGHRTPEIVRYASEQAHDLLVMTTHQVGPGRPGGALGTISHQVALLAPCSVLLVRS